MSEAKISVYQAIEKLGICRATFYNRLNELDLQVIKINKKSYIALEDLYQLSNKSEIIEELRQTKAKNQQLQSLLDEAEKRARRYQQKIKILSEQKEAPKQKSLWSFLSKK